VIRHLFALSIVVAIAGCADLLNAVKSEVGASDKAATTTAAAAEPAPPAAPEPAPVPDPQPNPELRKGLQCLDFKPFDLQIGVKEDYKVKIGMATETRGGFIKREKAELSDGCFLPVLKPNQCAHMLVNQAKFEALGNSDDWKVQCVHSDAPDQGVITSTDLFPYSIQPGPVDYKDMILLCGHDQDPSYACNPGSNSARGGEWQKVLEAKKAVQISVCAYPDGSVGDASFPKGRYVYCQYFNKKSGKSLIGFEYLRGPRT
jgi:hypothetical protein